MLCTWLLAALVATAAATQDTTSPQGQDTPSSVRPFHSDKPFARLFRLGADDPKTAVQTPLFRSVPGQQHVGANRATLPEDEGVDIVCGMTVIRKSPHIDRGIALPPNRGANIAVRRIEPDTCGAGYRVSPK
jgi:hypothetical protein